MSDFVDRLRGVAEAAALPVDGELAVSGLASPVEVLRDRWGVPYLSAASLEDLWFAQGFVTAGERLFQLDLLLRAANGRLSELFADRTLPADRFARTIGFNRAGARIARAWDETSRAMHARFRDGVFAWIHSMPAAPVEYMLLDSTPSFPRDEASWAAAFVYLAWSLSGNWEKELLRAWIAERLGPEAAVRLLPRTSGGSHGGRGSNNWVVDGGSTKSGKPLLANDPHLQTVQPGAWIEFHIRAPGYLARGVALPFSPGIILGTTDHHAWGVTNVTGDTQDLYSEHLNDDGTAAEYLGTWEPITIHHEEIVVRGETEPATIDVRETRHGPILESYVVGERDPEFVGMPPGSTYALRWTGFESGLRPSLALDFARAQSFQEFRAATSDVKCPGQNFVYADVDGTIGFQCSGVYPVRRAGDGSAPVAGWTDEFEWEGFVPFDELPWSENPESGHLVTANNRIHDDTYPHLIGVDFHAQHRAERIGARIAESGGHDVHSMAAIQADTVSLASRRASRMMLELEPASPAQRAAVELLRTWNGDMSAESAAAALFNVWSRHIALRSLEPHLGKDLFTLYHAGREAFQCEVLASLLAVPEQRWIADDVIVRNELLHATLDDALSELRHTLGEDPAGWRWGALHRLRLVHPLGSIPGLEPLFTAVDVELGGDEQTVMQGGFDGRNGYPVAVIASWRAVYDLGDLDRSIGVLPAGISGNPASAHWNDQARLWIGGDHHPLPLTRPAVEAAAVSALRLVPG